MIQDNPHDAVIVGGSIAGCVTALDLAESGLRVALLEKRSRLDHYKKICSHIIHPAGVKTLKRLGLEEALSARSSLPTYMDIESDGRSVCFPMGKHASAANIERKDIDPLLKTEVENSPNIETFWGVEIDQLNEIGGRVIGLTFHDAQSQKRKIHANIVIAADGRQSHIAKLDHAKRKVIDNERVALFAYFDPDDSLTESKVWTEDLGKTYVGCFPNQEHLLVTCYLPTREFELIKQDTDAFFTKSVLSFVSSKGISIRERKTPVIVAKDTSTSAHYSRSKNLAFVGDAFLAADPLTGVGCSWAMTSSELLTRHIAPVLASNQKSWIKHLRLDIALMRYRWRHKIHYQFPAKMMSLASAKGNWFFHPSLFGLASKLSHIRAA